jgi:hypothetical protein
MTKTIALLWIPSLSALTLASCGILGSKLGDPACKPVDDRAPRLVLYACAMLHPADGPKVPGFLADGPSSCFSGRCVPCAVPICGEPGEAGAARVQALVGAIEGVAAASVRCDELGSTGNDLAQSVPVVADAWAAEGVCPSGPDAGTTDAGEDAGVCVDLINGKVGMLFLVCEDPPSRPSKACCPPYRCGIPIPGAPGGGAWPGEGFCCIADGDAASACTTSLQCCSGVCLGGACACSQEGAPCILSKECCGYPFNGCVGGDGSAANPGACAPTN